MRTGVASLLVGLSLLALGCQREEMPPNALAKVNSTLITLDDFNRKFKNLKLETQFSPGGHESLMEMKKRFLDQLIEEALILQAARDMSVTVADQELEQEIMETKNDYKGESLREYLNGRGISFGDWKKRIRTRILIEKTVRLASRYRGKVSMDEARAYYEAHRGEYMLPERVKARQIVVATSREANRLLREVKEGKDFEKLAVEYSFGPESRFGGDLGYFTRGDMPKEFEIVFSMEKGQVSQVIKSPYGYHIFKVEDRAPPRQLAFEEVVDDIKRRIVQMKSEERYHHWLEELKKDAKVTTNYPLLQYTE